MTSFDSRPIVKVMSNQLDSDVKLVADHDIGVFPQKFRQWSCVAESWLIDYLSILLRIYSLIWLITAILSEVCGLRLSKYLTYRILSALGSLYTSSLDEELQQSDSSYPLYMFWKWGVQVHERKNLMTSHLRTIWGYRKRDRQVIGGATNKLIFFFNKNHW